MKKVEYLTKSDLISYLRLFRKYLINARDYQWKELDRIFNLYGHNASYYSHQGAYSYIGLIIDNFDSIFKL